MLLRQRHWNHLLHWPVFSDERSIFLNNIRNIDSNSLSENDSLISETLLFGISSFNGTKIRSILNTTIDYILSTKRFDVPLTNCWFVLKHFCIENISFKSCCLNIKSLTKFYLLYYWFRHIALALPCQLGCSFKFNYFYV